MENRLEMMAHLLLLPLFDFDIEDSRITYTGWKTELDYNGDLCVVLYYNFTNKQSEPQGAYIADYGITVYQNGVECDTTWLSYDNKDNSLDNYSKKITARNNPSSWKGL